MKLHVNCCSSLKINQIEAFIIDLSAAIDEGSNIELFNLQVDFEFNFLSINIAHSAPVRDTDHLFKHLDDSTDENNDNDVKIY